MKNDVNDKGSILAWLKMRLRRRPTAGGFREAMFSYFDGFKQAQMLRLVPLRTGHSRAPKKERGFDFGWTSGLFRTL
jgi:hypothetical protein